MITIFEIVLPGSGFLVLEPGALVASAALEGVDAIAILAALLPIPLVDILIGVYQCPGALSAIVLPVPVVIRTVGVLDLTFPGFTVLPPLPGILVTIPEQIGPFPLLIPVIPLTLVLLFGLYPN